MRYIQRIDSRHHSWKVALRRMNVSMYKYFTDAIYGGTSQALEAAIAWRDEVVAKHASARYAIWRRERVHPTNKTGLVGVYRGVSVKKRGDRVYKFCYWQGYWTGIDGKSHSRMFSIKKYGEEEAKELACRTRREGMAQVAKDLRRARAKSVKTK